jgi:YVTN family beta-propeller protein
MTVTLRSRDVGSRARSPLIVATALIAACHSSPPASRVFVSNENAGTVSVIDVRTSKTVATIPVGKRPRGLRVSKDGRMLYVALSGSPKGGPGIDESKLPPPDRSADGIGVVDLHQLKLVDTIPSGQDPESFDLLGDHLLVVSNEESHSATIVDVQARKVRSTITVGGEPEGVATAPDGTVWVTNEADNTVSVLDPQHGRVIATVATGIRPRGIAFDHDVGVITTENEGSVTIVDVGKRAAVGRVQLPMTSGLQPRPMGVVIDRKGRFAYVTTGRAGSIAVIDLPARKVTKVIENVGKRPWGIAFGRDGLIYTANGPSDDIAVIDPANGTVVRRIASGGSPWGVTSI